MSAPIIIVGGGPVGMSLAMNLDALGAPCILVNTEPKPRWHPKGSTHNARTMEHYRRLGVAGRIRKLGLPADVPTDVIYFTRFNAWELARIPMPSEREKMQAVAEAGPTDQVPEPIFRCNQMNVEAFLFEHVQTLPGVDVRFGWQCVDVVDDGTGVSAEIEHVDTGRRETLRGAYLVGCDGGQSFVRRKLGIRYGGGPALEQAYLGGAMVSSYVRAPDLAKRIFSSPGWQYWVVNSEIRSNIVAIDGEGEFIFNTRGKTGVEPDADAIARIFFASVGETIEAEFISHWAWTAGHALVADSFGAGRLLLAGDAVHLFTPAGGFGMNTGIDDAANLGWKLAAMAQGWGGPGLLDTFEAERRPIAIRNTSAARALGRNIGDVPIDPEIEHDSPAGEAARRRTGEYLASFPMEFGSIGIQLGARYDGSPIVVADGTAPPPDDPLEYVPSACPGGRAPHLWLPDGSSLFDRLGPGFTLLRLRAGDASGLEQAARRRGVPLTILDVDMPEARDLYAGDLALIRPDQHVCWRGNALPDDPDALLAQVTGWPAARR